MVSGADDIMNEYNKLSECWVGRSYSSDCVEDNFIKDILYETEEDLIGFSSMLETAGVTVKRPEYTSIDVKKKPQLLHARDHLQYINGKMYVGPRYESNIKDWLLLLDGRRSTITLDNLCGPSIVRADNKVIVDAVAFTRKRYDYLREANPSVKFVYERLSSRDFSIERHTDGVFSAVKEGVIIATHQARNLELIFPGWDILYLEKNTNELGKMNESKQDFVWHHSQIPADYKKWVGYAPETFFDVNCLQLDSQHLMVTRYNKSVFDFLARHKVEPIIVPFRHRYLWDGGLHCMTFDYNREDS
tara:strand:+ start:26 stop:934 length:909 start_codon:yes stop_codon:yes gene_type:complete